MGLHDVLLGLFFVLGLSAFVAILKGNDNFDDRLIMMLVWSVGLSLLLSSAFASDYIRGADVHREYLVALQTSTTGVWRTNQFDPYTSVLSVAILPAMINILSGITMVQVFKFVYPVLFSLVPVILYKITRKIFAPGAAFLSVFLFMSYDSFYDQMIALGRQEIAEILLTLLILVLLSPAISKSRSGTLTLIFLTFGFVASHYALAYIFIFILAYSCLTSRTFRKTKGSMLLGLVSVVGMAWYMFAASGAGFLALGHSISSISGVLTNGIFGLGSRPQELSKAIGSAPISSGLLQEVNRWTQILVQLCLLFGLLVLVCKKKSASEQEMLPLITGGLIVLGSSIVLPEIAATLNLGRIYHIALLFISPCFIYATERVELTLRSVGSRVESRRHFRLRAATQRRSLHVAAAILFLYFLFVSGWFTVVTAGVPTSYILDSNRMRDSTNLAVSEVYYGDSTVLPDIVGTSWLRSVRISSRAVCSDINAQRRVLTSYGEFPPSVGNYANYLPRQYNCHFSDSYVYLSEFNNRYGVGFTFNGTFPISDISQTLSKMNRVYSNGETTLYA
jgi:uncharacterized membrane protein